MKISALAFALVAVGTGGCPGKQAPPTSVAGGEPGYCDVVSAYLADVAAQEIHEPMPQLDGFESNCATDGAAPHLVIVCRADTPEEFGDARYDELTSQIGGCFADWEKDAGDTDPSGAPETYRWTTLSKAGSGALALRLHWYENRLVLELEVSRD